MNNSPDHHTTAFMNANGGSYPDVTHGADATSAGRLLSTTGDDKHPNVRMTKPARNRIWVILVVLLIIVIVIVAVLIAVLASKSPNANEPAFEVSDKSQPRPVLHYHVRCDNSVIMVEDGNDDSQWRNYNNSAHIWKTIPNVENAGFVLISPKYRLEAGYPGVQISMLLPKENARFHIMVVTPKLKHSSFVTIVPKKYRCESVAIDDPEFFQGDEIVFRVYVFYRRHMPVKGIRFTVTALPLVVRYKTLELSSAETTIPQFKHIKMGDRDVCSVEIENSKRQCNWWNVEDGDNAEFEPIESHECIDSGARSTKYATWFFAIDPRHVENEMRALLISPIIERTTPSVLLTLWYIFKCEGPHLRIHLIPAEKASRRRIASSTAVAEIASPASHNDWKFASFQILLPPEHSAYHIVLEGIVTSEGNCSRFLCTVDAGIGKKKVSNPMLGLDSITIEHMSEQCENTTGASVADCKFQTEEGGPTTCGWIASGPPVPPEWKDIPGFQNYFTDWKTANSGDGTDHGATAQHLEGRGYIMSFDASGRAKSESYFRTPLLVAGHNCSCVMEFQYLMRGLLTPRMQVNMIYGDDINDDTRQLEPQWSLLGHQSEDWQVATIAINLKKNSPFQIELRVLDIYFSRGDVHFDDMHFIGCDMKKHNLT